MKTMLLSKDRLTLVAEIDEDNGYVIECPDLPGCFTQGQTLDEALANIEEVIEMIKKEQQDEAVLLNS